jgi:hypothetical protein
MECMAMAHETGVQLAEVGFLLIVIAGIRFASAQMLRLDSDRRAVSLVEPGKPKLDSCRTPRSPRSASTPAPTCLSSPRARADLDAALRRHTAVAQAPPSGTLVRLDQGLTRFRGGVSRSG